MSTARNPNVPPETLRFQPPSLTRASRSGPQRTAHGSSLRSAPYRADALRQPQDGEGNDASTDQLTRLPVAGRLPRNSRAAQLLPNEPEDARLTGTTRSLSRRVMGLAVAAELVAADGAAAALATAAAAVAELARSHASLQADTARKVPAAQAAQTTRSEALLAAARSAKVA